MPAQPKRTKKRTSKTARKKQGDVRAIKKAVDQIPHLIMQEMEAKRDEARPVSAPIRTEERTKRIWLWAGVSFFSTLIFVLWFFNVSVAFYDAKQHPGQEKQIFDESKNDLQAILNSLDKNKKGNAEDKNNADTQGLKGLIASALAPLLVASTTDSSTPSDARPTDRFSTTTTH